MARTQSKTSRGKGAGRARRPVRLPEHRKKRTASRKGPASKILRGVGVLFLCVLVGGVAFAGGGYLGLIKSVQKLDEPRIYETHPTYIYSAPLGENEYSRSVIGTIFEGQNRKTSSLSEMPPQLLNAVVAKEDERFREHSGWTCGGSCAHSTSTSGRVRRSRGRAPSPSSTSGTRICRETVP